MKIIKIPAIYKRCKQSNALMIMTHWVNGEGFDLCRTNSASEIEYFPFTYYELKIMDEIIMEWSSGVTRPITKNCPMWNSDVTMTEWKDVEGFDLSVRHHGGTYKISLSYSEFRIVMKAGKKLDNV